MSGHGSNKKKIETVCYTIADLTFCIHRSRLYYPFLWEYVHFGETVGKENP